MLSALQVVLHTVYQAVGLRRVAQLSTGLVNLEGLVNSYASHLHWRMEILALNVIHKIIHEDKRHSQSYRECR